MQVVGKDNTTRPCVATIGTFDGVHRGHQFVVQQVVNQARERGLDAVVLTFPNHPLQVLRQDFAPQFLTLADEKLQLLRATGVDRVEMLEFTPQLAQKSAHDFMQKILKERFRVDILVIGYDNHFGHGKSTFQDYVNYGKELGIRVFCCQQCDADRDISSTAIRQALRQGDVTIAHHLLNYPYFLQGIVVKGFQNGRKLGYPTANIQVHPYKLIPSNGVYLVKAIVPPSTFPYPSIPLYGMLNIGTRPTLHNGAQCSIEVHLFDFDGDLYGISLRVELLHRLRGEKEFHSLDDLKIQLQQDEQACRLLIPPP